MNCAMLQKHAICLIWFGFLECHISSRTVKYTIIMFRIKKRDELFYVQSHLVDDDVSNPCFLFPVYCCCSHSLWFFFLLTIWLRTRKWDSFYTYLALLYMRWMVELCVISATSTLKIRKILNRRNVCSLLLLHIYYFDYTYRLWHNSCFMQ